MKINVFLIIILILISNLIKGEGQDSLSCKKIYSVNLRFGMNQIREMNLLPLVHKGTITELSFETEKIKGSLRHFQLFFTYSRIKTSLEEMSPSGNIRLGMDYSYNFLIVRNNNLRYYLGPQTSLCYSFMLFPNWDESHSYWANYLSVGANNILSVAVRNKSEWFTSLNFSVASLFSRPDEIRPYKMDDNSAMGILSALNSNIETGSMNKLLQINLRTEYRFPVFVNKKEAITFNMDILRLSGNSGQPVLQIINSIGLKIML